MQPTAGFHCLLDRKRLVLRQTSSQHFLEQGNCSFRGCMFSPVQPEEMAFALILFVSAASGQLSAGRKPLTVENMQAGRTLFLALSFHNPQVIRQVEIEETLATPLFTAFLIVWEHYKADPGQASLGARLLGFYYLMTESRGAALDKWVSPSPAGESLVELDPHVIETLATISLEDSGRLNTEKYLSALRSR